MRKARIFMHGIPAGVLEEVMIGRSYRFIYDADYSGPPVSLAMPWSDKLEYAFDVFPPLFDGLLPEGVMLEALLKQRKLDHGDFFGQLMAVGADLVGAITVEEIAT